MRMPIQNGPEEGPEELERPEELEGPTRIVMPAGP